MSVAYPTLPKLFLLPLFLQTPIELHSAQSATCLTAVYGEHEQADCTAFLLQTILILRQSHFMVNEVDTMFTLFLPSSFHEDIAWFRTLISVIPLRTVLSSVLRERDIL